MNKILVLLTCIVIIVTVESSEKVEAPNSSSSQNESYLIKNFINKLQTEQEEKIEAKVFREARSSPVGSIGAYITSYWEKKKRRQMKTKKPTKRPYYHQKHKHCYYDYY